MAVVGGFRCYEYLHMLDVDVLQRTFSSQRRNLRVYTLVFVLWTYVVRLQLCFV